MLLLFNKPDILTCHTVIVRKPTQSRKESETTKVEEFRENSLKKRDLITISLRLRQVHKGERKKG